MILDFVLFLVLVLVSASVLGGFAFIGILLFVWVIEGIYCMKSMVMYLVKFIMFQLCPVNIWSCT